MRILVRRLKAVLSNFDYFTTYLGGLHLRPYQLEAAEAVIGSVLAQDGETFVWKFARQGGKDETLAALYQYLMALFAHDEISIIAAAPTFKPQTEIAIQRLDARLSRNLVLQKEFKRRLGHIYRVRKARTIFCSAHPSAQVVGLTAWPLLVINEAQDVLPAVYDKRFAPMAAAHNATRLFSGTAWTHDTLLAREERLCRIKEGQDGRRRVFAVDGREIARVHPPYGLFLESEIARFGLDHPIILTQYLCRELDAQSGMFNAARRALMKGDQVAEQEPIPGGIYVFMLDVAGQDESRMQDPEMALQNEGRDAVSLTVARADLSLLSTLRAPVFRVVKRLQWTGLRHGVIFGKLNALADQWRPQHIVVDATGVGEGLWDMLDKAFPTKVIPVKFTQQVKSDIGYRFLAIIETGRFRDDTDAAVGAWSSRPDVSAADVDKQYAACRSEILIGPQKTMRWGVPDGTRDENGQLIHDDIILSDSLIAKVDELEWHFHSPTLIVQRRDPLEEMSRIR